MPRTFFVLSIYLQCSNTSQRWKEVTEVRPDLYAHHLEVRDGSDIDDEVSGWLREAFDDAAA